MKVKHNDDEPKIITKKISYYSLECPYCKKMLDSVYLAQLNHNFKIHVDNCKLNPRNEEIK